MLTEKIEAWIRPVKNEADAELNLRLSKAIKRLKRNRKFFQTLRLGILLVEELRAGRLTLLNEHFEGVIKERTDVMSRIDQLERALLASGGQPANVRVQTTVDIEVTTAKYEGNSVQNGLNSIKALIGMKPEAAPKSVAVQQFETPDFGDLEI